MYTTNLLYHDWHRVCRDALRSTNPSQQQLLYQNSSFALKTYLIWNHDLIPELFPKLLKDLYAFEKYRVTILQNYKSGFKYKNPATQELLEKYLILF